MTDIPTLHLDGKVALVTGTSSGLGVRFAEVLDAAGAAVVVAARRTEAVAALAARLRDALPVTCDVRRDDDRAAMVAAAIDRYGHLDVLVGDPGPVVPDARADRPAEQAGGVRVSTTTGLDSDTDPVLAAARSGPLPDLRAARHPVTRSIHRQPV